MWIQILTPYTGWMLALLGINLKEKTFEVAEWGTQKNKKTKKQKNKKKHFFDKFYLFQK